MRNRFPLNGAIKSFYNNAKKRKIVTEWVEKILKRVDSNSKLVLA